jgi:hypothetical protein
MSSTELAPRSPYIVGPVYDWILFLAPPVLSLAAGAAISGSDFSNAAFMLGGEETTAAEVTLGTVIHAHLVAVLFRSHGNPTIFRRWPLRFVLVPALLWLLVWASAWVAATATVVATFWDVWHSGAQTFGLARIYDRNAGSKPEVGRRLDFWAHQLLYAGPILAGATLIDHLEALDEFSDLGATFFSAVPAQAAEHQRWLTALVLGGGALFLVYYAWSQLRLRADGYARSPLTVWLVTSTGACSIVSWGFNTWGEAFFTMNLFHAVQYLALVWCTEGERITQRLRFGVTHRARRTLVLMLFVSALLAYGVAAQVVSSSLRALWALTLVISLMHFWYDGFVWSVRKSDV